MISRHHARQIAVQALYSWEINRVSQAELLKFSWVGESSASGNELDFARLIVQGCIDEAETIEKLIRQHLTNWDWDRVALVERAVLRVGTFSLRFQRDIPPQVTIDEAVELTKALASDDSYRFVNGVLDGINRTLEMEQGEDGSA